MPRSGKKSDKENKGKNLSNGADKADAKKISIDADIKIELCKNPESKPVHRGWYEWATLILALMPVLADYEKYIELFQKFLFFIQNL